MIVKEKEGPFPTDKMGKAGYDAERQMAFYLRRAFGESPDVFVFNDLRFVRNGEAAQIDLAAGGFAGVAGGFAGVRRGIRD